ncbi:hypothetical protein FCV25MIE_12547 [Fagus crenata]
MDLQRVHPIKGKATSLLTFGLVIRRLNAQANRLHRLVLVCMERGLTLATLGTSWWTLRVVLAIMQMVRMEGNTWFQHSLTHLPNLVQLWSEG